MKLTPVATPSRPVYPAHRRHGLDLRAWARRVAVAAAASSALWIGGCYGSTVNGDDEPEMTQILPYDYEYIPPVNELPEDMAGGARAPGFQCETPPSWGYEVPAYLDGSLCGEETSFGELTNQTEQRVSIELSGGRQWAILTVLGPDGGELAELSDEESRVELLLPEGTITFAANAVDPVDHPYEYIDVSVQLVE